MTAPRNRPQPARGAEGAPIRSCLARWLIVVAAWGALHLATAPALAMPAPWHPGAVMARLESDAPFIATIALAHLAVSVVGLYAVVMVTVGVVVHLGGLLLPRRAGAAQAVLGCLVRLALPGTRSLLAWSIGIASLGGSMLATSPASAGAGSPPPNMMAASVGGAPPGRAAPPVMSLLPARPLRVRSSGLSKAPPGPIPPTAASAPVTVPASPQALGTATPAPATPAPAAAPSAPEGAPPPPADIAPTATTSGRWVVQPGDHLWSISERTLAAAWGVPPGLEQLGPYWWRVVTANRATLPNPADIDLLFPGDVVTLPPLPGARPV